MARVLRSARSALSIGCRASCRAAPACRHPWWEHSGVVHYNHLQDSTSAERNRSKSTLRDTPGLDAASGLSHDAVIRQQAETISSLQKQLGSMQQLLIDGLRRMPLHFSVGQYNVLAGYLGNNMEPWFLYGIDLPEEKRKLINELHQKRDEKGQIVNRGWPNYVRGVLSEEEIATIERVHGEIFSWNKRKDRILKVIQDLDTDLLSIVECDNYDEFFKPELTRMGYDSVWKQRPRDSSKDGCCIAWRRDAFELVAVKEVEYIDKYCIETRREFKDRIALLTLLRSQLTGDLICFVSTHLARNPENEEFDRLRSRQIGQVARALADFAAERCGFNTPVVLTGDLNATQFERLLGIAFVATLLRNDTEAHPFIWDCKDVPSRATSVTTARQVRIDAILYQSKQMVLVDAAKLPHLTVTNPIPNPEHPSDHLPVKATFRLRSWLDKSQKSAREWYRRLASKGSFVPMSIEDLRDAFTLYDHDGTGHITTKKLREAIIRIVGSTDPDPADIERVLSKLPPDGTDFAAFVEAFRLATLKMGFPALEDAEAVYSYFDKDASGGIDLAELTAVFDECSPVKIDKGEVEALFKEIDKDGNGTIELDEYISHLKAVWISRFKI